jgi:hypothetical protein
VWCECLRVGVDACMGASTVVIKYWRCVGWGAGGFMCMPKFLGGGEGLGVAPRKLVPGLDRDIINPSRTSNRK